MIQFKFNERKAAQVAARLISHAGGEMNYLALMKLLYIIDREGLLRFGRPLTGDRVVAMKHGPVLSRTFDLVSCKKQHLLPSEWHRFIPRPEPYVHAVRIEAEAETFELSQAEIDLIDEVFAEHRDKDQWELVELTHTFPEWKDPGSTSIPIPFEAILAAAGMGAEEIEVIGDHADADMEMARILEQVSA